MRGDCFCSDRVMPVARMVQEELREKLDAPGLSA